MPEDQLSPDELAAYAEPSPAAPPPPADALSPDELAAYEAVEPATELASAAVVPPPIESAPPVAPAEPPSVRVVFPDGVTTGTVPATDVEQARLEGYTVVTPEMEAEARLQASYGDTAGQAIAAIQGFGRGATLGVSDYLGRVGAGLIGAEAEMLGLLPEVPRAAGPGLDAPLLEDELYREADADAAAQATRDYQAANQGTAVAAEITGAIAPALLTGGTGAAATAARLTPAGRLAGLGQKMGTWLTKEATEAGLGAAGRIAGVGVAAGFEGAVDNATRVMLDDLTQSGVSVEALERTAERMLPAAWDGMKYSAILGVGGMAVAEGLGRLAQGRAAREVAEAADDALPASPLPEPDLPPPEAVRPPEDIAADLEAAQKRLDEAEAAGLQANTDEAETALGELLAEQERAVLAREGISSDGQIEAKLLLDPSPEAIGIIDRIDAHLNTAKNAKELELRFKDSAEALEQSITKDLDDLSRFKTNVFDTYTNRSNNPRVVRAMVEPEGVTWGPEVAQKWMGRLDQLDESFDDVLDGTKQTSFSKAEVAAAKAGKESVLKMRQYLTRLGKGAQGPVAPGARIGGQTVDDVVDAILGFDQLKSHLGAFAQQAPGGRPPTRSQALFQRLYMQVRADLQDPRLVGKAFAEFQTAKNAAITRAIRKGQLLRSNFARAGSHEAGGQFKFGDVIEYDPKKVGATIDGLADPRGRKDVRDLVAGLTAEVELMETLAKHYPMPPEALATIKAQRQVLESLTAKLRAAKELAVKAAEAQRLASQTSVLGAVLEGIRGIPYGGAAFASLIGSTTSVARGLSSAIVGLGKGAVKQEQQLTRAARETVRNFVERTPQEAAKARKVAPLRAAEREGPTHLRGVGITTNELRRAVEESQALQTAESNESRALDQQLAEIRDESPELADAIGAKVRAKAEFIASKVPPLDASDPFRQAELLMDPLTERSVARYVAAARDPMSALERLADGTGTAEDKETLRTIYPGLYQRFVDQVQAQIKETKRVPTAEQRQRLHFATGIPMSREQQPKYLINRHKTRQAAGAGAAQGQQSEQMKPLVTPANASTEFASDKRFASRTDSIMTGTDD